MKRQLSHPSFVEVKQEEKKKEEPKPLVELDAQDLLWIEILKTLDKLEKGVEGDLSALARSTRNINKFRKRLPNTTWIRILHSLIPINYKKEFTKLLALFIDDIENEEIKLISILSGVDENDAKEKLSVNNNDVNKTLLEIIDEKERLAKIEIKKRQKQLKRERLEREQKKKGLTDNDEKEKKKLDDNKMDIDDDGDDDDKSKKMEVDTDKGNDDDDEDGDKKKDDEEEIKVTLMPLRDLKRKRKFYPETYIFLELLISLELYDRNNYNKSSSILLSLINFSKEQNRRTSDLLSSRLYQFYALCEQRVGNLSSMIIRKLFYDDYQIACLQQNESAQSILIVLILQCYIELKLYNLAHKFVEKADFPESSESQYYARYHYYRGRIDCVQLQYSDALYHTQQAIRRAPQTGAYGFKLDVTRWLITIELLMGDIPDRSVFDPKFDGNQEVSNLELNAALEPFYEITQSVREGNLEKYEKTLQKYHDKFIQYGLAKILLRLRHNVIKTGLRKINKSYSKISLKDIANKLKLSDEKNAYFIVSKAIHDNVISAKIDYKNKSVESLENINIYATNEPYHNFSQRIKFCLEIRNQAVKSLRYPPNKDLDDEKKKKEEEDEDHVTPEEIAEMIQKHFEDDDE